MNASPEEFWRIEAWERQQQAEITDEIERLTRSIQLGKKALALQGQPGFQDFVQALEDVRNAVARQLLEHEQSNEKIRFLQGKCVALRDVLTLLTKQGLAVSALESRLADAHNRATEMQKSRPIDRTPTKEQSNADG